MDVCELRELIEEAVRDADLTPAEIPTIDLYVDQITSLAADKVREGAPRFHDRVLTKTMINNYSKDGLISPIKGKKYSKEQILQMLLVYSLKNTLSICEIKRVLQNVYQLPEYGESMLEETYSRFLTVKQREREGAFPAFESFVKESGLNPEDESDFLTLILSLASISSYCKTLTQALLEAHYPDVDAEKEREEQEKREAEKKQKKEEKKAAKAEKAEKAEAEKKQKKEEKKTDASEEAAQ